MNKTWNKEEKIKSHIERCAFKKGSVGRAC
jgi:hypothetical protein